MGLLEDPGDASETRIRHGKSSILGCKGADDAEILDSRRGEIIVIEGAEESVLI